MPSGSPPSPQSVLKCHESSIYLLDVECSAWNQSPRTAFVLRTYPKSQTRAAERKRPRGGLLPRSYHVERKYRTGPGAGRRTVQEKRSASARGREGEGRIRGGTARRTREDRAIARAPLGARRCPAGAGSTSGEGGPRG